MADGVDEPDQLPLICGEGAVSWRDRPTKERDRVLLLQEHGAEAMRRSITFDHEWLAEIREGEDRCYGHGRLQRLPRPCEAIFFNSPVRGAAMAP